MISSPPVLIILPLGQLMIVTIFIVHNVLCLLCLCCGLESSGRSSVRLVCDVDSPRVVAESSGHYIVVFEGDNRVIIDKIGASDVASEWWQSYLSVLELTLE
jgi:hypothetical protein